MKVILIRFLVVLALSIMSAACSTGYAPVSDISSVSSSSNRVLSRTSKKSQSNNKRKTSKVPRSYKVRNGDTLYSIAWKYGLDFRLLAKNNKLPKNFLIYKGQILKLGSSAVNKKTSTVQSSSLNNKSSVSSNRDTAIKTKNNKTNKTAQKPRKTSKNNTQNARKVPANKRKKPVYSNVRWHWPAKGKLVARFSQENKGLDIKGSKGESVFAAAKGKVVYAGNGIIGYGNLIIIKHSQEYLSAYAHNSVILVEENEAVKAKQKIAEIGNSGTIKTILHFEIRKGGKPIDPLRYLPKK